LVQDSEEFGKFGGLVYLSYEKITVPCGRLHQISPDVLDYTDMTFRDWNGLFGTMVDKEEKF